MDVSYKKDGNSNVMIIKNQKIEKNDYKFRMIMDNDVNGIIPMSLKIVDNVDELHYHITSMISLVSTYARKKMSGDALCALVRDIQILSESMKEYLLDINNIMFDPEFIYIKRDTEKHKFCYSPQKGGNFHNELRNLFEKILGYIDYRDKKAVVMAYEMQKITLSDNFTIVDLVNCAKNNMAKFIVAEESFVDEIKENQQITYEKQDEELNKKRKIKSISDIFRKKNKYKGEDEIIMITEREVKKSLLLSSIAKGENIKIMPEDFPCIIGKSRKNCDFFINSSVISRVHMKITKESAEYFVEDLNSTNGSFVNGMRLMPQCPVKINIGDKITLADIDFIVEEGC